MPKLTRFRDNQRLTVTDPLNPEREPLRGRTGEVVRRLMRSSYEAWVRMDEPLPDDLRAFWPPDPRQNHILLDIDECSEAK